MTLQPEALRARRGREADHSVESPPPTNHRRAPADRVNAAATLPAHQVNVLELALYSLGMERLRLTIETEREDETGRWIADVVDLPGVMLYGATCAEAVARAKALALDVISDRLTHGEDPLTGCEIGEACPPFEAAAEFPGVEFLAVAC
jgi:predicted RNase H-like HicB family nuclease